MKCTVFGCLRFKLGIVTEREEPSKAENRVDNEYLTEERRKPVNLVSSSQTLSSPPPTAANIPLL
jgi:hypothetical protein